MRGLIHGDAYEILPTLPDKSVDMILTDPPYGCLQAAWDIKIDVVALWQCLNRVIKDNGAIIICTKQPFATEIIMTNKPYFRYELIWKKTKAMGFLDANRKPLAIHENILVFYRRLPVYNPQKIQGEPYVKKNGPSKKYGGYGDFKLQETINKSGKRFPVSCIEIPNSNYKSLHPTQKPFELFAYLVKTYTNEGDIVLDPFSGSGTTAIACQRLGREFLCIEKEREYHDQAVARLAADAPQPELALEEVSE